MKLLVSLAAAVWAAALTTQGVELSPNSSQASKETARVFVRSESPRAPNPTPRHASVYPAKGAPWLTLATASLAEGAKTEQDESKLSPPPETEAPITPAELSPETVAGGSEEPSLTYDEAFGVTDVLVTPVNVEPWTFRLDLATYYTDNVALASSHEQDDTYLRAGLSIDYVPRIRGGWFGEFGLRQHFYRSFEDSDFDFDFFTASAGFFYVFERLGNMQLGARYRYERVTDDGLSQEIFTDHSVEIQALRLFRPARGHEIHASVFAELSFDSDFNAGERFTIPGSLAFSGGDLLQRNEYGCYLGYVAKWTPRFTTSLFYRFAMHDYREHGREDWNHLWVLATEIKLREWLELTTHLSATVNESNDSRFDYDNFMLGAGVALRWQF